MYLWPYEAKGYFDGGAAYVAVLDRRRLFGVFPRAPPCWNV